MAQNYCDLVDVYLDIVYQDQKAACETIAAEASAERVIPDSDLQVIPVNSWQLS